MCGPNQRQARSVKLVNDTKTTTPTTTTTTREATAGAVTIATIVHDARGNDVECYNDSEYVELVNSGTDVDRSGWSVTDAKDHTIRIPSGYRIVTGERFRIYTGSGDNQPTSRYFDGRGQAIWNNTGGDTATLKDNSGQIADVHSY